MNFAATIGTFDGVHLGHVSLLSELRKLSTEHNLEPMVITFSNIPRNVIKQEHTKYLTTIEEKKELLLQQEIKKIEVLNFNDEISKLKAEDFIKDYIRKLNVKLLLLGYNHRFGSDNLSFDEYSRIAQKYGIEIVRASKYGENCSSSEIRNEILGGKIEHASTLLGRNYTLQGTVVKGDSIGRTIGFPTANIEPDTEKLIPGNGVYICKCQIYNQIYDSMCNIGYRPTLAGNEFRIEVHILDFQGNLYGKKIKIEFCKYLRKEMKFRTLDELSKQISKDVLKIREK